MFKEPTKRMKAMLHVSGKFPGLDLDKLDDRAREVGLKGLKMHMRSKGVVITSKKLEKYGLHDDFNHMMRIGQTIALAAGRMKLH
jgi:hypothetical protein